MYLNLKVKLIVCFILIESSKIDNQMKSLELLTIKSETDPDDSLTCSNISVPPTPTELTGGLKIKHNVL